MRWDEHGWDNYGPATMWDVTGGVDANGKLVAFDATSYRHGVVREDTDASRRSASRCATPGAGPADTTYSRDAVRHPEPADHRQDRADAERRTSRRARCGRRTRCRPCFATEQVIDQLAYLAGSGSVPVPAEQHQHGADRTGRHADRERDSGQWQWRDSLIAVAKAANWKPQGRELGEADRRRSARVAASRSAASPNSQAAIVADIEVNMKTGKITVEAHRTSAAGRRPDGRPEPGREPDDRRADHGRQPGAVRSGHVRQAAASRASTGSRTRCCASRTIPSVTTVVVQRSTSSRPATASRPRRPSRRRSRTRSSTRPASGSTRRR